MPRVVGVAFIMERGMILALHEGDALAKFVVLCRTVDILKFWKIILINGRYIKKMADKKLFWTINR
jgi:hypothetical protein